MQKTLFLLISLFSLTVYGNEKLTYKNLLCPSLLWGFDFTSANKVNVIRNDINNQTLIKEYYYETDLELPFINIYSKEENLKNNVFSIHLRTFRIDVWTMTSGGNTTREIIPSGFCKITNIEDILNHIESLKINY